MSDSTDRFVLDLDASPAEAAALRDALAETPALAQALGQWQTTRHGLRAALDAAVPDRELLVLYALSGDALPDDAPAASRGEDLLDAADRARLDTARPALDAAFQAHPGLTDTVRRIRADRDAFETAFDAADVAPSAAPIATPRQTGRRAADRAAVPAEPQRMRRIVRFASLAAVVMFAGVLTMLAVRDSGWETITADSPRTVRLADGSTADLAAGAVLMISDRDLRQARLRAGDATFRIQHDPANPFTVQTMNADITVLGTTFEVDAGPVETEVTLIEGKVTLAPREQPALAVTLAPGQRSRVLAADAPSAPEAVALATPIPDALAGPDGDVVARDEALASVADRLGSLFGVDVAVAPALADEPISGTFSRADGAQVSLSMLARTLGARLEGSSADGFRIAE